MMLRVRQKFFRKRKPSGTSTNGGGGSDGENLSDFDSSVVEDDDSDEDGPTVITVDDGKGGIKHIRVPRPPDRQIESLAAAAALANVEDETLPSADTVSLKQEMGATPTTGGAVLDGTQPAASVTSKEVVLDDALSSPASLSGKKSGLGYLLRREYKDTHPFQIEPNVEKLRKRLVSKKGVVNIHTGHLERGQKTKLLFDFFNTMLDMRWRYVLTLFTLSFFLSWLGFAAVWYAILYFHGDFDPDHLPGRQAASGWVPCVQAIQDFRSCLLFSIETQHTIGYGSRQTTEECVAGIITMSFQSVVGVMIQACMVGIIFAKLSRPKKRADSLIFSKNAVVCLRDGALYLCFRVANMRSSHLVECHTRAILVSKKVTEEGEIIPYHQTELSVGADFDGEEDVIFFIWPSTIVHKIDQDSPFYNMSARDFLKKRYEIIVVLEGIVEPTGMSIQCRSSYLPNEILWGYNFANVLNYKWREETYKIDYTSFNKLFKCEVTPKCSARVWHDTQSKKKAQQGRVGFAEGGSKRSASTAAVPSILTSSPTIVSRSTLSPNNSEISITEDILSGNEPT